MTEPGPLEGAIIQAAAARAAIAAVVDEVRSEIIDLDEAFARGDSDALTGRCFAVKVFEVVPGIGKVRARRTMETIGLAEDIWLRDVPEKQRAEIVVAFATP